ARRVLRRKCSVHSNSQPCFLHRYRSCASERKEEVYSESVFVWSDIISPSPCAQFHPPTKNHPVSSPPITVWSAIPLEVAWPVRCVCIVSALL
ncbi:AGAP012055-PA, partial [Anopheles gambiae str. PEST]